MLMITEMNRFMQRFSIIVSSLVFFMIDGQYAVVTTEAPVSTETCDSTQICRVHKNDKPVLYILSMAPYPDPGNDPSWPGGPAVTPGVLLAAQHINCHPDILPNHQIKVIISDGGCDQTTKAYESLASNVFFNQTTANSTSNSTRGNVVGIVGGGCSESAIYVAEHVARPELSLIQIAPSATSPLFVPNGSRSLEYPNTLRLTVNALSFIDVFKEIIRRQNYTKVAVLYDFQRTYMLEIANAFGERLRSINVTISPREAVVESFLSRALEKVRGNTRVIFVLAGQKIAEQILCTAYHKKMLFPDYQLIFINRRARNFVKNINVTDYRFNDKYFCSEENMMEALSSVTIFEPRLTRKNRSTSTISGYTYNDIECQYLKVREDHRQSLGLSEIINTEYQNAYYDSTWALAMSLNNSQSQVDLNTYKYGQPNATKTILDKFFEISFEGAVGHVQFTRTTYDTRFVAVVNIYQQFNGSGESRLVAYYDPQNKTNHIQMQPEAKFVNSSTFEKEMVVLQPPFALGIVFSILTILTGLVILGFHYVNWMLGDIKNVKATSPQLNHLIFSGCYLLLLGVLVNSFISVFLIEMKTPDLPEPISYGVMCNLQVLLSSYACSLIFGTICMKTWRIWRIFSHFRSTSLKFAGDTVLVGFVVALIVIDTIYSLAWVSFHPLHMVAIGENSVVVTCSSSNNQSATPIWVIILVCYKMLLIGIVLFLAIKTRKISRREFKQTKSINTLIYILLFTFTLGTVPHAIVTTASQSFDQGFIIAAYVLYCTAYTLATILCAIFVFVPPIYPVVRKRITISSIRL